MKRFQQSLQAFMPWSGLVVGLIAIIVVHQFGSDGVFDNCTVVSRGPLFIVAILGLLACAASAFVSWRSLRGSGVDSDRVVATISVGSAILFIFAMLLAVIAALVLPPCFQ